MGLPKKEGRRFVHIVAIIIIITVIIGSLWNHFYLNSYLSFAIYLGFYPFIILFLFKFSDSFKRKWMLYEVEKKISQGSYNEALKVLNKKRYEKIGPNVSATKSVLFMEMDEYEKSEKILKDLLSKYPNFLPALYHKACLESLKGDISESMDKLKRMVKIYKTLIDNTKDPLSKLVYKHNLKKLSEYIRNDEDLQNLRGTKDFKKLVNSIS